MLRRRPEKKKTKQGTSHNNPKTRVQKRVFEETIEVLDSNDDFVIPNPIVRGKRVEQKVRNDSALQDLDNFDLEASVSETSEDYTGIEIEAEITKHTGLTTASKTVTPVVIDIPDIDDEEDYSYLSRVNDTNTKDAWKGLMQRMQQSQTSTTKTVLKQGKGKGFKKSTVVASKASRSKFTNSSLNNNKSEWSIHSKKPEDINLESPPKKLKLEIVEEIPSTSSVLKSPNKPVAKMNSNILPPDVKIPTMFLKPEEKAAALLTEKMERAKIQSNPNLTLSVLSEPQTFNSVVERPDQFDGNVVLPNDYDPAVNPYAGQKKKACPFYKKLPGTTFSVDAFNYGLIEGIDFYFLSHFHSDHYVGLTKKFCKTLICSPPTANLVRMKLYVEDKCIRRLQLNKPYIVQGVEVVLIDANHCPGSVMFIFRLPNGITYLHTGDFRFTTDMLDNHFLQGLKIDNLYLDTTYCDPKYDFPTQVESIVELIAVVKRKLELRPKTLIICGSYVIGKERVYFSLAEALNLKVFVDNEKKRVINALENPRFSSYLSDNEDSADIHVAQMFSIVPKMLSDYLAVRSARYTNIIGIKPSGWQFSFAGSGTSIKSHYHDTVTVIGVPYSEHSSFSELQQFVCATKPKKVQPTVNVGSESKRTAMMTHINKWLQS